MQNIKGYLKAVFKYWWWLVAGIVGGGLTIPVLMGHDVNIALPVGLGIIFICFSIAQFLAYNDLKKQKVQIDTKLQNAEWDTIRKYRIKLINEEEYPEKIFDILNRMRPCLDRLLKEALLTPLSSKELWDAIKTINPTEYAEAIGQITYDDNTNVIYSFYRHLFHYSEIKLNESDTEWMLLDDELEVIKSAIPCLELKDFVVAYYMALKGINAVELFYGHLNKVKSQDLSEAVKIYRYKIGLLDYASTRIARRIQELRSGGEPKWEQR